MPRNFKDWIDAYLEYTSASEAPDNFHRWTGIATIAGVLRRRVRFNMGTFRWFPNFFLCFVSPPGIVSKTTTVDIGMDLLRRVPKVRFGANITTWQALVTAFANAYEDFPSGPMSAITIVASELGNLVQPGDQSILTLLTELWDGRDNLLKATKKEGEELVTNPWVQLVACTTPSWIAHNLDTYFIGGGFASRTLFIYADHKRKLVAYPDAELPPEHTDLGNRLVADLEAIATLQGDYRLSDAARRWGAQWYDNHNAEDNPLRLDPRFGGYFARKQTHIHKTAMALAASRGSDLTIHGRDLRKATEWVTALERDMLETFGVMNREKITDQMASVLGVIRERGRITRGDLYRNFSDKLGYATFAECLNGLVQAGLATIAQEGTDITLTYRGQNVEKSIRATDRAG